jgi:hypothetical protein
MNVCGSEKSFSQPRGFLLLRNDREAVCYRLKLAE